MDLSEHLLEITTKLSKIEVLSESTLAEAKKTNGRVTKLEDYHLNNATKIAVLEEKVNSLEKLEPEVNKQGSLLAFAKGNWQGILITLTAIAFLIDKALQLWPKK